MSVTVKPFIQNLQKSQAVPCRHLQPDRDILKSLTTESGRPSLLNNWDSTNLKGIILPILTNSSVTRGPIQKRFDGVALV